jgi:hypothetical protein
MWDLLSRRVPSHWRALCCRCRRIHISHYLKVLQRWALKGIRAGAGVVCSLGGWVGGRSDDMQAWSGWAENCLTGCRRRAGAGAAFPDMTEETGQGETAPSFNSACWLRRAVKSLPMLLLSSARCLSLSCCSCQPVAPTPLQLLHVVLLLLLLLLLPLLPLLLRLPAAAAAAAGCCCCCRLPRPAAAADCHTAAAGAACCCYCLCGLPLLRCRLQLPPLMAAAAECCFRCRLPPLSLPAAGCCHCRCCR